MRSLIIFFLFVFFSTSSFALDVESIVCGLGVKNRAVIKKSDEFKVGDKVYCMSVLKNVKNEKFIINRWISDEIKYDIKLNTKPSFRFRTWSYKTVYHKGVWKMEVLDDKGNLIKEKIFVVK